MGKQREGVWRKKKKEVEEENFFFKLERNLFMDLANPDVNFSYFLRPGLSNLNLKIIPPNAPLAM